MFIITNPSFFGLYFDSNSILKSCAKRIHLFSVFEKFFLGVRLWLAWSEGWSGDGERIVAGRGWCGMEIEGGVSGFDFRISVSFLCWSQ